MQTEETHLTKLYNSIKKNNFTFSPYFGHAYCPAVVFDGKILDTDTIDPEGKKTTCVVLDESETYDNTFEFRFEPVEKSSVIIERHLHHFFKDGNLERRVLKHWIPTNDSEYEINRYSGSDLSKFVKIDDKVVCLY